MNIYADLPKVLYVVNLDDAGEGGAASCPHCGAQGRYIYWFMCEDGTERGAMRGCFSHFPKHPFADRYAQILEKEKNNARKGWTLASWDEDVKSAIERCGRGEITQVQAWNLINAADRAKNGWMKRKGYRR